MKNIQFDGETMAWLCKKRAMACEKNGKIAGNLTIIKLCAKKCSQFMDDGGGGVVVLNACVIKCKRKLKYEIHCTHINRKKRRTALAMFSENSDEHLNRSANEHDKKWFTFYHESLCTL